MGKRPGTYVSTNSMPTVAESRFQSWVPRLLSGSKGANDGSKDPLSLALALADGGTA